MVKRKKGITYEKIEPKEESNLNLVFIHGTGGNKYFLKSFAEEFKEYNCYLMELPGHGDSDDRGYTAESYVNAIKDFISDMENVILLGHSLGGAIVVGVGELNLPNVKGLIILNGAAKFYKVIPELKESIINNDISMDLFASMLGDLDNPDVIKAVTKGESIDIFLKDSKIAITVDYEKNLNNIDIPVCIITGENDLFAYPEFSEYLDKEIKTSELYIIPNAMHSLPIVKKKEVHEIIKGFLDKYNLN